VEGVPIQTRFHAVIADTFGKKESGDMNIITSWDTLPDFTTS
jgi:hypothetical protein